MRYALLLTLFAQLLTSPVRGDDACQDLPINAILAQYNSCLREMQTKLKNLRGAMELQEKNIQEMQVKEDVYSYSFRFKGAEILAKRQKPDSRLYFYATPGSSIKVSVYLATQKFPINLVIDGKGRDEPLTDSVEDIEISGDDLEYQSLKQFKIATVGAAVPGMPVLKENLRPKGVHYIEFSLGVGVTISESTDYEVSGVVVVTRKKSP